MTDDALRLFWNLLLISSVLTAGLKLAFHAWNSISPRTRYLFCVGAFALSSVLPVITTFIWTAEERARHTLAATQLKQVTTGPQDSPAPARNSTFRGAALLVQGFPRRIVAFIWLAGSFLLLARELASHLRLRSARNKWRPASHGVRQQLSWPSDVPLYVDSERVGPGAVGFIRPCVVLPCSLLLQLPATAMFRIALHELDHVRWRDPLANSVMRLALALGWPAAPLWSLYKMACSEREAAADRAAIHGEVPGVPETQSAVQYAQSLVVVARMCARNDGFNPAYGLEVSLSGGRRLEERVQRLFQKKAPPDGIHLTYGAAFLLASVACLPWLPVALQAEEPPPVVIRERIVHINKQLIEKTDVQKTKIVPAERNQEKWEYLGKGYWKDPLGNRKPPEVMAPWKDLGNGKWLDGNGKKVPASRLPSWVYLGNGVWYTPHAGDWINHIDGGEPNESLIANPSQ
jgi:beta-lactamase regulating signal transducer with metallopeptidase domain